MPAPVWVLSVDLQTKTATFTSGLGEAARAARGTFNEIKEGGNSMGRDMSYSMTEARHSVHLLTDEFGIHIPRALTSFIAGLGPVGVAMEAAFPYLAIIAGLTILGEKLDLLGSKAAEDFKTMQVDADKTVESMRKLAEQVREFGLQPTQIASIKKSDADEHVRRARVALDLAKQETEEFRKRYEGSTGSGRAPIEGIGDFKNLAEAEKLARLELAKATLEQTAAEQGLEKATKDAADAQKKHDADAARRELPEVIKLKRGHDAIREMRDKERKLGEEAQLDQLHATDAFNRYREKQGEDALQKITASLDKQIKAAEKWADSAARIENRRRQSIASLEDAYAQSAFRVLAGQQSFASMMQGIGESIISNTIQQLIAQRNAQETERIDLAKSAARHMYVAGTKFPWPLNLVMPPVLAAGAFGAMMAFAEGGIVPGVERGDVVPARLTPGEAVLPKQMTERLSRATDDTQSKRGDIHVHVNHSPTIHALDAAGMERVLQKNAAVLNQHLSRELRKMNR